jgi:hypothetical protein
MIGPTDFLYSFLFCNLKSTDVTVLFIMPSSEHVCTMSYSSVLFSGVCSLNAKVSEHCLFHLNRQVGMKCNSGRESVVPHFLYQSHASYLLTYKHGTDRVF